MLTNAEVTRLLDIANAGVQKGQVALARTVYNGILECRPDHIPTLISLAMSHLAVGEYDDAETVLRDKVLSQNPDDPDGLAYLGLNAFLAGRKDEAAEILAKVPEDTPAGNLAKNLLESL